MRSESGREECKILFKTRDSGTQKRVIFFQEELADLFWLLRVLMRLKDPGVDEVENYEILLHLVEFCISLDKKKTFIRYRGYLSNLIPWPVPV